MTPSAPATASASRWTAAQAATPPRARRRTLSAFRQRCESVSISDPGACPMSTGTGRASPATATTTIPRSVAGRPSLLERRRRGLRQHQRPGPGPRRRRPALARWTATTPAATVRPGAEEVLGNKSTRKLRRARAGPPSPALHVRTLRQRAPLHLPPELQDRRPAPAEAASGQGWPPASPPRRRRLPVRRTRGPRAQAREADSRRAWTARGCAAASG